MSDQQRTSEKSGVGEVRSQSGLHPRTGDTPTPLGAYNNEQVAAYLRALIDEPLLRYSPCASDKDARCCADIPTDRGTLRIYGRTVDELARGLMTFWRVCALRAPKDAMADVMCAYVERVGEVQP